MTEQSTYLHLAVIFNSNISKEQAQADFTSAILKVNDAAHVRVENFMPDTGGHNRIMLSIFMPGMPSPTFPSEVQGNLVALGYVTSSSWV